jgi:hypothetical protein
LDGGGDEKELGEGVTIRVPFGFGENGGLVSYSKCRWGVMLTGRDESAAFFALSFAMAILEAGVRLGRRDAAFGGDDVFTSGEVFSVAAASTTGVIGLAAAAAEVDSSLI